MSHIITLRACARGKAIGFVCLLSAIVMKIARSPHLGIWRLVSMTNPSKSVKNWFNNALNQLAGPGVSQIRCFIGHTYRLQAMCYLLMPGTQRSMSVKIVNILAYSSWCARLYSRSMQDTVT